MSARLVCAGLAASLFVLSSSATGRATRTASTVEVIATGLNDPRGLTFGPNGDLYVAEAGSGGGTESTVGLCDQVAPPVGPFTAGHTARVLHLGSDGELAVVADQLPSAEASPMVGGDKQGASAVAFVGNTLYALIAGGGCSHGHLDADNGIIGFGREGAWTLTNLSAWLLANPGAKGAEVPRSSDYEPDGVWYSLLNHRDRLLALEPNHGLLVSVDPRSGDIDLERDLFATFGDYTYTVMAADRGSLYIGTLGQIAFLPNLFPPVPDLDRSFEAGVYRLGPNGEAEQVVSGLKAVLGIAFDRQHRLYVLQSPIFVPGTGSLVRVDLDGHIETVVEGLRFPSGLAAGLDGAMYVTECGYHCAPGDGRILRIDVR